MKAKAILSPLSCSWVARAPATFNSTHRPFCSWSRGSSKVYKSGSMDDDGTSIAPDGDLWAFIGDELRWEFRKTTGFANRNRNIYAIELSPRCNFTGRAVYVLDSREVKKRNMPMELVLLPIVESALILTQRLAPMPRASGRSFRAGAQLWFETDPQL